jgi:alpha-galactosidase
MKSGAPHFSTQRTIGAKSEQERLRAFRANQQFEVRRYMDRRVFVKGASLSAALAKCGLGGNLAPQAVDFDVSNAPAEILVSKDKWILRNGLIQKQLFWNGKELLSQLGTRSERFQGEGSVSDIAVRTAAGLLPDGEFRFVSEKHDSNEDMVSLELHFVSDALLDLVLRYSCRRGDAAIEQSCVVQNSGATPIREISHFDPMLLALTMPSSQANVWWIEGLHDDSTKAVERLQTYLVCTRSLGESDSVNLESGRWSSNEKLPAVIVSAGGLSYFAGLGWSGEWEMTAVKQGSALTLQARLADFSYTLAPGETIVSPTAFYGVIHGGADEAWNGIHAHCKIALIPKVADDFPWVTYNTWYNFGDDLDEKRLITEVDRAADLGIEVFYIDDGWQEGSDMHGKWGMAAGNWTENHQKFPSGLANFANYIHARGMKFGLWVEPERVDIRFVDRPGSIERSWIATRESEPISIGFNGPSDLTPSYQVCLGSPEARRWAINTLLQVVRDYHVDWLKWDHNMYQPCSDWRHGHQAGAGDWAHIQSVYEVMRTLLKEFPDLIIENCAGGGHRFDYGIMRFSRVTWTSDVTEPAHVVRSHLFGASHAYPSQYLTTWYVRSSQDLNSIKMEPAQIDSLFRSRMMGAFGISDVLSKWSPEIEKSGRRSIELYKRLRKFARGEQAWLTPQPTLYVPANALPIEWDAMQYWLSESDESTIYAFRSASPSNEMALFPKFLAPGRQYQVSDEDGRIKAHRASGDTIMRNGISAIGAGVNTSAILYIRRV